MRFGLLNSVKACKCIAPSDCLPYTNVLVELSVIKGRSRPVLLIKVHGQCTVYDCMSSDQVMSDVMSSQ